MKTRRARVVQRLGVIAAVAVVAGSYFTGMAFAADEDGDGGNSTPPSSSSSSGGSSGGSLVKTLEDAGLPDTSDITDGLGGATGGGAAAAAAEDCSGISLGGFCFEAPDGFPGFPSLPLPSGSPSTTPTGPSGSNTQIVYSPYPYPVFGDYGHRYYGRYRDSDCGCDRYAAPTYNNSTVVREVASSATQVSSVPKGGVDTGDGSFQ